MKLADTKDLQAWTKGKEALLFVSFDSAKKDNRMLALKHGLLVLTELETFELFLQSYHVSEYSVSSLQEWFQHNEKEVTIS